MSWRKCPGVPRGQPPGIAADKCISSTDFLWFFVSTLFLKEDVKVEVSLWDLGILSESPHHSRYLSFCKCKDSANV